MVLFHIVYLNLLTREAESRADVCFPFSTLKKLLFDFGFAM